MWKFLVPVVGFGVLILIFVLGLDPKRDIHALPSPLLGKSAPQFRLDSVLDGQPAVDSSKYLGHVYVFNVWATWCVGCRQEHETLLAIAQRGDVPLVGLDWKDDRDKARQWLSELGNPYAAVAFDEEGRTAIDWGVYGAPETFLVDGRGRVLFKHIAPMTLEVWERDFLPRIAAARANRS